MYMSHESYYTYIAECADGTYYIGKTFDLTKRFKEHNGELKGGAKYTHSRKPIVLKYHETYETNSLAMKREIELKKLTRAQKEKLIASYQAQIEEQ